MAGTFSQIYIQLVFAVEGRQNLIHPVWKDALNKYISGIIRAKQQKAIIVNGMPDHIHAFVGMRPSICISALVRDVKNNSSNFVNSRRLVTGKFSWQEGYGAFSYSYSHIERVYNYIYHQDKHHQRRSFKEEYFGLLEKLQIPFQEEHLFEWIE